MYFSHCQKIELKHISVLLLHFWIFNPVFFFTWLEHNGYKIVITQFLWMSSSSRIMHDSLDRTEIKKIK